MPVILFGARPRTATRPALATELSRPRDENVAGTVSVRAPWDIGVIATIMKRYAIARALELLGHHLHILDLSCRIICSNTRLCLVSSDSATGKVVSFGPVFPVPESPSS
jgi:hypothetical protein